MSKLVKKLFGALFSPSQLAFYSQRLVMGPRSRQRLAEWSLMGLPRAPGRNSIQPSEEVCRLAQTGFVMMPNLVNAAQIDEVCAWLSDKKVYDRWKPDAGLFAADAPPDDCHTALFTDEDVIHCPHLLEWANDELVLGVVAQHLGVRPTLSNLTAWWSYPGHAVPQEAENFHRDVDDLRFLKLFVYLTDVDEGCGPHVFVPGSQSHPGFRRIRRFEDEEVEAAFGANGIKHFTGPRGTAFLENTFGLHKGQLPARGRRLLFQAQYSLRPIGIYGYRPQQIAAARARNLDPYINRLYVKQ